MTNDNIIVQNKQLYQLISTVPNYRQYRTSEAGQEINSKTIYTK